MIAAELRIANLIAAGSVEPAFDEDSDRVAKIAAARLSWVKACARPGR